MDIFQTLIFQLMKLYQKGCHLVAKDDFPAIMQISKRDAKYKLNYFVSFIRKKID